MDQERERDREMQATRRLFGLDDSHASLSRARDDEDVTERDLIGVPITSSEAAVLRNRFDSLPRLTGMLRSELGPLPGFVDVHFDQTSGAYAEVQFTTGLEEARRVLAGLELGVFAVEVVQVKFARHELDLLNDRVVAALMSDTGLREWHCSSGYVPHKNRVTFEVWEDTPSAIVDELRALLGHPGLVVVRVDRSRGFS